MEEKIKELLRTVIHPETGDDIVAGGNIENITAEEGRVTLTLHFTKARDPFAIKLKNQTQRLLTEAFPETQTTVVIREGSPRKVETEKQTTTGGIAHVIAIASGKGGVGKSTVTANLAISLRNMGYRVGVLDADIYGPSQPKMFCVEQFVPDAEHEEGVDKIIPAESMGIRLMSIGFFIKATDALLWRGAMASNALKQLVHQTKWGELDFLLIDLPPGTGDIHLSIINELKIDAAVIVSTPQQVAVADVIRGVELFRNENVNIPIAGIIENMAWFTPAELPNNKYYLFGRGGARKFAEECGVEFLGEIPIIQSVMDGGENGTPASTIDSLVENYYHTIGKRIVDKVMKK